MVDYAAEKHTTPPLLSFALAALIIYYRGTQWAEGRLQAKGPQGRYLICDDDTVVQFFYSAWAGVNLTDGSAIESMVKRVLAHTPFWGMDLNTLPDLTSRAAQSIQTILADGMPAALVRLLEETEQRHDR
jgi:tagaturonate reductase